MNKLQRGSKVWWKLSKELMLQGCPCSPILTFLMQKGYGLLIFQRANLFALETLILKCREKNINLVLVMWPGADMHEDNFDGTQIFNCSSDYQDYKNNSRNHIIRTQHKRLLMEFTKEILQGKIKL